MLNRYLFTSLFEHLNGGVAHHDGHHHIRVSMPHKHGHVQVGGQYRLHTEACMGSTYQVKLQYSRSSNIASGARYSIIGMVAGEIGCQEVHFW